MSVVRHRMAYPDEEVSLMGLPQERRDLIPLIYIGATVPSLRRWPHRRYDQLSLGFGKAWYLDVAQEPVIPG